MKTKRIVAAVVCVLLITLSISCMQVREKIKNGPITYKEKIEQLKRGLQGNSALDPDFQYFPGVVKKTEAADIELDKASGILYVKNEILVFLKDGKNDDDLIREARAFDITCTIVGYVPTFNIIQLRLDSYSEELIERIRHLDSVENAERSHVVQAEASTGSTSYGWPIANYDIQLLWEKTKGKGVTIAVLDTGLDMNLPQFAGRISNPYSVVTASPKFEDTVYLRNKDLLHVIDHGTKVAGVACAYDPENRLACGIAPEASLMPVQVFGFSVYQEKIVTNDLMVVEGIARAIAFKADIINLSLGSDYSHIIPAKGPNSLRADELDRLYERLSQESSRLVSVYDKSFEECVKHGVLIVCSAGNDGIPAAYQPIPSHWYPIVAGSINNQSRVSGFSNNGDNVDCYAPGEGVPAISPGGKVFTVSGTSYSAPYVSGIIALAKSYGMDTDRSNIASALRYTNLEGRLSILDVKSKNIFYPIAFFNFMGAKIEEKNTLAKAISRFKKKYGSYFIQQSDSDEVKLYKIFSYYAIAGKISVATDPEARFAISLVPKNFEYILRRASGYMNSVNYYAALILTGAKLSQKQLETACELLPQSDYMSIILKENEYQGAIPGYYKRLAESSDQFNANTLHALSEMKEYGAIDVIKSFLKARQENENTSDDEDAACYSLSWLCSPEDEESAGLIVKSFERYEKKYEQNVRFEYSVWRNMAEALVRVGNPSGFMIALKAVEELDDSMAKALEVSNSEDEENETDDSTDYEYNYKEFQRILNTYTNFGFKFDYAAKGTERKNTMDSFYSAIQYCKRTGRIYTRY